MAGQTLGDLTTTSTLSDSDLLLVSRAAGSRSITASDLRSYIAPLACAHYYMVDNATSTALPAGGEFVKLAGTTTEGGHVAQFTASDNRATYSGTETAWFRVLAISSITDGNNQRILLRIAKNGTTIVSSQGEANTASSGRADCISAQTIVQLSTADYIEVWAANATGASSATAVTLNLIAERLH